MMKKQRIYLPGMGLFESADGIHWHKVKRKEVEQKGLFGSRMVNLQELRRAQAPRKARKERQRRNKPRYRHLHGIDSLLLIQGYMPTKAEIRKEATRIYMEEESRHGLPAILPEEDELKEAGYWEEGRIRLMSGHPDETLYGPGPTNAEAEAQHRKYLEDAASGIGLKLIPAKEYKQHEKAEERAYRQQQQIRRLEKEKRSLAEQLRAFVKQKPKVKLKRVSLRKPLDIGAAARGKAKLKIPVPPRVRIPVPKVPKAIVEPTPKPKRRPKRHIQRAGKTMKVLRKPINDGKRVFAFPDDVWKVRK